jgi:glutamate synthase domain-containing protein 3
VLVLGTTGRNFAAGMTGGLAYVFDEDGTFPVRCNTDLVDMVRLDPQDEENIRALLARHHEVTGGCRALDLLKRWDIVRSQFWRVHPRGLTAIRLPQTLAKVREHALR